MVGAEKQQRVDEVRLSQSRKSNSAEIAQGGDVTKN